MQYLQQTISLSDIYGVSIIFRVNVIEGHFSESCLLVLAGMCERFVCICYRGRFTETCVFSVYSMIVKTFFVCFEKI